MSETFPYIHESLRELAEPIEGILPDEWNAKMHGDENMASIRKSLSEYGQVKPIVVNRRTNRIEAGHGTVQAARDLGWSHVAVVRVDDDEKTARKFGIADNRTAELSAWNEVQLALALQELTDPDWRQAMSWEELEAIEEAAAAGGGVEPDVDEVFAVVVTAPDQQTQLRLQKEFEKEGRKCRLITS